ncbi:MAG: hypothetical protein KGS44_15810 [Alphaproteobacteria bacterium]|nr:hypothetical protein [Alphaproteobacteria bacterium]
MRRLWVISHYDRGGGAADYVLGMLRAYRALGGDLLVVSTADLSVAARMALRNVADALIERENLGLDFASWRLGLEQRDGGAGYDEIILANDSIFGPFADISPFLARLRDPASPFLGLTLSLEVEPHVQSFFMGFNMSRFPRLVFDDFWDGVRPLTNKRAIIENYEIGLSRRIAEAGIPLSAVFDMRAAPCPSAASLICQVAPEKPSLARIRALWAAMRSRVGNPMIHYWREALLAGVPYVKVELLRDNPYGVQRSLIHGAIGRYGGGHLAQVRSHLSYLRSFEAPGSSLP